jgi:aminomethyltransferase
MFDVSHMLALDLRGAPVRPFLRRLLANSVDKLRVPGKALYSCLLNERGGVLDDLIVYFMSDAWFRMVVNAAAAEADLAWVTARRDEAFPGVEITPRRDLAMVAVQGPNARSKSWQALPEIRAASEALAPFQAAEAGELFVGRTGYTGEDGFEIMIPATRVADAWEGLRAAGVAPAGLGARDTLRLEAGMNLYGQDMDTSVTPLESGLAWTVDLAGDRDFIGRQALLERPQRRLVGLLALERGVLRSHQKVRTPRGEGETTSGSFSPTLEQAIALARVPVGVEAGDEVGVDVRGRMLPARVVKYPFVRNGKRLV